jgi:hypothetical protein
MLTLIVEPETDFVSGAAMNDPAVDLSELGESILLDR